MTKKNKTARTILATNVRRLREAVGLTQEKLAEHCGLHRTYVSHLETERANVTMDTLDRLAEQLGVRVGDLLSEEA